MVANQGTKGGVEKRKKSPREASALRKSISPVTEQSPQEGSPPPRELRGNLNELMHCTHLMYMELRLIILKTQTY